MKIHQYFRSQAYNNAWANHRLLTTCAQLPPQELSADRGGFSAEAARPKPVTDQDDVRRTGLVIIRRETPTGDRLDLEHLGKHAGREQCSAQKLRIAELGESGSPS